MEKIDFLKFSTLLSKDVEDLPYETIKIQDQEIIIKQYLPIEDKIKLITNVLQKSADDNNFANPIKLEVWFNLELIKAYTNIDLPEEDLEYNPTKVYDLLEVNNIFDLIAAKIDNGEYQQLYEWTMTTIEAYYKYRNSAMGIFEQISADYSNLELDAAKIQKEIADPSNLTLLKEVLTKLG